MTSATLHRYLTFTVLLAVASAASAADWVGPAPTIPARQSLDALLRANPLGRDQNLRAIPVQRSAHTAQVLVQVRDREPVHYHADSDITVFMIRGHGVIHIADESFPVKEGDVMFIPRKVVHYFVNRSPVPAAALVIYSPPPGPKDRVLIDAAKRP